MAAKSRVKKSPRTRARQRSGPSAAKKRVTRKSAQPSPKKAARRKAVVGGTKKAETRAIEAALAAFAHEVRTPLTGILAISSLLATSDLPERERRWVETIKTGAEHLAGLATLFVDAARRSNAELTIRQDFFDLRALARAVGEALEGRATAKGLQSEVEIDPALPAFVIGDSVRLRAALENLIDNAVKFTSDGEVALKVSNAPGRGGKPRVMFAISDSGIGLSPAEIRKLFRPFSQANVSIAARFGGAGLGLSSVKQFAQAMNGDIVATRRAEGGMVFTLTVTLERARDMDDVAGSGEGGGVSAKGLRILSVEDNPFSRVVLNAILTELGHRVEFIGQGEEVVAKIEPGGFDAVLMDMVLPGIDGIETIRRVRALSSPSSRIAIIGVSGRAEDEAAARAAGADAFLVKPVNPRVLAAALFAAPRRSATAT